MSYGQDFETSYDEAIEAERRAKQHWDDQDYSRGEREAGYGPPIQPGEYATRKEWTLLAVFVTILLLIVMFVAVLLVFSPRAQAFENNICNQIELNPTVQNISDMITDRFLAGYDSETIAKDLGRSVIKDCPEYKPLLQEFVEGYSPNVTTTIPERPVVLR